MVKKIIDQNGITMITLIVTIVIMLILAGASISIIINKDFFGKADNMNQMNEQAINVAQKAEEDALKQDVNGFQVDEGFEYTGVIEAYEYVTEKVYDETLGVIDKKEENGDLVKSLKLIDISLAQYIEEKGDEATVYFKLKETDNNNLYYLAYTENNPENSLPNVTRLYQKEKISGNDVINMKLSDDGNDENDYVIKNTILEVEKLTLKDLENLTIRAQRLEEIDEENAAQAEQIVAKLNFSYNSLNKTDKTIYIPAGKDDMVLKASSDGDSLIINNSGTKIREDENGDIWKDNNWKPLKDECIVAIATEQTTSQKSKLSEKTYTNIEGLDGIGTGGVLDTSKIIESTIGKDEETKLCIVQEIENEHDKYIYMDDIKLEVYNPIKDLQFAGPYYIPPVVSERELNLNTGLNDNVLGKKTRIIGTKGIPEVLNVSIEGTKISSVLKSDATLPEKIDAEIEIEFNVCDYGGISHKCNGTITMSQDSFTVLADGEKPQNFGTLTKAVEQAKVYLSSNKENVIIQQNIDNYPVDENLYTVYEVQNENNHLYTYKADFDIGKLGLNGVTYDLNGYNLLFKWPKNDGRDREVRLIIGKGVTFNLKSTEDADKSKQGHQNGEMIFDFAKTFQANSTFKYISFDSFVSTPKFAKYKTLTSFIESREPDGAKWYHYLYYGPIYINYFLIDFKVYWNSLNVGAVQNIDYEREVDAVKNHGTFNFHSGCIVLTSEEQVRAFGAWDGSVVLDIAEGFLSTLRGWGLDVASITDYATGFASLKHTGTVISNYKEVILGEGEGINVNEANPIPYPEIVINLKSKEEGIGVTMGSIFNPNRTFTRAYGVWNKNEDAVTTMNSGFISMIIRNDTNNWVSLGIGRAYGIFNDQGTTYLNGFTRKNINVEANYYGLGTLIDEVRVDFKNENLQALGTSINSMLDDLYTLKNTITNKTYNGFYTFSTQKILYNFTGGATIVFTNSYAVANAYGRPVDKVDNAANDGIILGNKLSLEKVSFEVDWNNLFTNNDQKETMKSLIPVEFYYRLYNVEEDPERKNGMDYNLNTHQKIINPLNTLFEGKLGVTDELVTSALGSFINGLNNIAFSSWIGEDFQDKDDVFASLIQLGFDSVKQSITNIFK